MGWLMTQGASRRDVIADRIRIQDGDTHRHETLRHCLKGNVLWSVIEVTEKATGKRQRFIGCDLLRSDREFGWGYKDMCESVHPYYYTCPLSYLDEVPVANEEWREKVREYHRRTALPKVGEVLEFPEGFSPRSLTIVSTKPLRGRSGFGGLYRIRRKDLAAADRKGMA